jgi:N utilization substance protein B
MRPRRRARHLVLEILYEFDIAQHNALEILQRRLHESIDDEIAYSDNAIQFARDLLVGVTTYQDKMDVFIARYAPEWPLDQIAVIDRNILRIAIYEVLVDKNTPIKVAINEAVELAKSYGSDSAPRFVNGVLGTLTDHVEALRTELSEAVVG